MVSESFHFERPADIAAWQFSRDFYCIVDHDKEVSCVGFIFYGFHRWLPTTPSIEIVLTLITPYCMYFLAEHFHFSGVLAVVSGGLFLSGKRNGKIINTVRKLFFGRAYRG